MGLGRGGGWICAKSGIVAPECGSCLVKVTVKAVGLLSVRRSPLAGMSPQVIFLG